MTDSRCPVCGAVAEKLVCHYCGALIAGAGSLDEERRALDEFHGVLQGPDEATQIKILRSGFLPQHEAVLIDAGLRCFPFADPAESTSERCRAGIQRLETISAKLRLMPPKPEIDRAVAEFSGRVAACRKSDRRWNWIMLTGLLAVIGAIVWGVSRCTG